MNEQLGQRTARGAVWSVGSQVVTTAIGFLSVSILARLVSPEAFGMVAMVVVVVGLGEMLRDFGLTNAVIQADSVSREEKVNLFWLNTAIGFLITSVVFTLASPIASFYESDQLANVVRVLSLTFLVNGICTQPRANLIRDLRIRAIATVDVISAVSALLLALILAFGGMGVWAIVGLQMGRHGTGLVATLVADRFIPSLPSRKTSIRSFARFGLLTFAARIPVFISMNIDSILIGRNMGAQALGYYSRAYQLALLPTQQLVSPLSRVMLPTLSRLKDSPELYNRALLQSQSILTTLAAIGYPIAIVFAPEIIRIVLGPNWDQSVLIFQVLAFVGMIDSANNLTYWVFVSKGIPYRHLQYSLIGRPILVAMVIFAVPHGVIAVAWSYVIWITIAWIFGVCWAGATTDIPVHAMLSAGAQTFLMCLTLIGSGLTARHFLPIAPDALNIVTTLVTMVAVLGVIVRLCPGIRRDVKDSIGVLKYFRRASS